MIVTNVGRGAMDAEAATDDRGGRVRQNRVVPTPVAGAKLRGGEVDPTGLDQPPIRQRRRQDEFVSGESAP